LAAISSSQESKKSRIRELCQKKHAAGKQLESANAAQKRHYQQDNAGWSPLLEFLTSRLLEFLAA
jgi:hypothetical protein